MELMHVQSHHGGSKHLPSLDMIFQYSGSHSKIVAPFCVPKLFNTSHSNKEERSWLVMMGKSVAWKTCYCCSFPIVYGSCLPLHIIMRVRHKGSRKLILFLLLESCSAAWLQLGIMWRNRSKGKGAILTCREDFYHCLGLRRRSISTAGLSCAHQHTGQERRAC